MKTTFLHLYGNIVQALTLFVKHAVQPVYYAGVMEASIIAGIGLALYLIGFIISRRAPKTPLYEMTWREKCLQFFGVFGTVSLLIAFLRYEGIPYASMTLVLVTIILWMLVTVVQLLRYRRLVVQVARTAGSERKARDAYLPESRKRPVR